MQFYKNDLIIAYIKELLKDFNLPLVPVLTDVTVPYKGRLYIKDRKIGYFGEKRAVFHRPSFSVNEFFIYNYLANNQCRFS